MHFSSLLFALQVSFEDVLAEPAFQGNPENVVGKKYK
jgi:hypothetical protein